MNLCLEFDDLHFDSEVDCLPEIEKLVTRFPNIKLSFFTIPCYKNTPIYESKHWCESIAEFIDKGNVELCVHGFYHSFLEFKDIDYRTALTKLETAHSIFYIANLKFSKIFRGPHWGINENTYKALEELDYSKVFTHQDYSDLIDKFKIRSIIYNQNLADEIKPKQITIAHGHTHNVCGNGISESFNRIVSFIDQQNPDFVFCSEV